MTDTNIGQARRDFGRALKFRAKAKNPVEPTKFRQRLINRWVDKLDVNVPTAATMYNICRVEAIECGDLDPNELGRGAQRAKLEEIAREADVNLPWIVYDKETNEPVSTHRSRHHAYQVKTEDQVVRFAEDVVDQE